MGRSFESVRMGVKDVSARWLKASKALNKDDQIYGQRLAELARRHSSEAFYSPHGLPAIQAPLNLTARFTPGTLISSYEAFEAL